jgi:hypothetical protein
MEKYVPLRLKAASFSCISLTAYVERELKSDKVSDFFRKFWTRNVSDKIFLAFYLSAL